MIITFCGTPGSGKSTIAPELSKRLGYTHLYVGGIRRQLAKQKGITIEELNKLGETDPSTDYEADEMMKKVVYQQDNLAIESRTAGGLFKKWGVEKETIHVYIKCSIEEGAKRIYQQKKEGGAGGRNENFPEDLDAQIESIKACMESDDKRYMKYYGFSSYDEKLYDIVIDTTNMTKDQEIEETFNAIRSFAKSKFDKDL